MTQHPIPEDRLADLLAGAADGVPVPPAPIPSIVARGARQRRLRRIRRDGAVGLAVVALLGAAAFVRGGSTDDVRPTAPGAGCPARLAPQVVPDWARAGFSDAEPRMPLVLGDHGRIVAIVFGDPLLAPPDDAQHSDKILWVPKEYGAPGPLRIDATPEDGGPVVHREVPEGPGPSGVELPTAGCWRLTLTWGGGLTDTMRLRYSAPH